MYFHVSFCIVFCVFILLFSFRGYYSINICCCCILYYHVTALISPVIKDPLTSSMQRIHSSSPINFSIAHYQVSIESKNKQAAVGEK